jgi:hypothetical protein
MSDCQRLSDRMAVVVQGRVEWTPEEARHLSGCPACQDEWELVRSTSQLGEEMPALNAGAVAVAVLQRLKDVRSERFRRRAWSFAGLAAAATLAAVIWSERPVSRPVTPPSQPLVSGMLIPLPELDNLQPAELDSVLRSMDDPVAVDSTLDEDFLDSWEG